MIDPEKEVSGVIYNGIRLTLAGSGESAPFIVKLTESEGVYSVNKSNQEIYDAMLANMRVLITDDLFIMPLVFCQETEAIFACTADFVDGPENVTVILKEENDEQTVMLSNELLSTQNDIADLSTIRSGAALGATAVQPTDYASETAAGVVKTTSQFGLTTNYSTGALMGVTKSAADYATAQAHMIVSKGTLDNLGLAKSADIPTAVSELTNDSGYLTEHQSLAAYRTAAAQDIIDNGKVDKVTGKGLSTNDYTNVDKAKVDSALTSGDTEEAETLQIDSVVTSGSTNLITSGAVYSVLGDIEAAINTIRGIS